MWFRNLIAFRLPAPWAVEAEMLEQKLSRRALQPCGQLDRATQGWLPPRREGGFVHQVGGQWLLCLGSEQKLLPASIVNQFVQERALEVEQQQGFKPGRKQLRELKERITDELLPRAFVRRHSQWAWIDPAEGWLVVDAASEVRAEEFLEILRDSIGELPVRRVDTEVSPGSAMTAWLSGADAPAEFSIDRDLELRSPDEEKATVRYVRHALEGEEIAAHIASGKRATRLALTWRDRVSLVLSELGHVKRLTFLDIVREQLDSADDDPAAELDAQFSLMTGELRQMLPAIITALGGERSAGL